MTTDRVTAADEIEVEVGEAAARWVVEDWERLLDALPVAVLLVATDGTIRCANAELARLTGHPADRLTGQPVEALLPEGHREGHRRQRTRYHQAPYSRPMGIGLPIECRRADGTSFPVDVSLAPVHLAGERYVVAIVRDDTERRRNEEDLFRRAVHDPLTGLPNRALLLDRLGVALARTERPDSTRVAVLFVDLDGFKPVNDQWGHGVGDDVLRVVAQRLAGVIRPADTVARFGGDEFVILCEGAEDLLGLGNRLVAAVAEPIPHGVGTLQVGASVGVVVAAGGLLPHQLVDAADQAMFRAKRAGGSRVEVAALAGAELPTP